MKKAEPSLSYIPTVCDYLDVFPEEFLGLPPQREIEFEIDVVLGATPASITDRTRPGYPSRVPRVVPPSEVPLYNP